MTTTVGIHHAKTHLSELLRRVESGEEIIIVRGREPVARLVSATPSGERRRLGADAGELVVRDDFDAPLPEHVLRDFEG